MPDQLQLRGGTTTEHDSFTGASKEVTVDTEKKTVVVHDGATAGGNPVMREDGANSELILGSAATPSLKFTGDLNTGIFSPGADQVAVSTGGTERVEWNTGEVVFNDGGENYDFRVEGDTNANLLFVDASADAIGIGTSAPAVLLDLESNTPIIRLTDADATGTPECDFAATGGDVTIRADRNNAKADSIIAFEIDGSEKTRIDSSGRLLVGTSSSRNNSFGNAAISQIETTGADASLQITRNSANSGPAIVSLAKSRSTSLAGVTIVSDDDQIGAINFEAADGSALVLGAQIRAIVDGTPGANDMPSRLVFSTTADGASSPTARMTIDSSGNVGIGATDPTVLLDLESNNPVIRLTDSDATGTPECEVSGAGGDLVLRADRDNEKTSSLIGFEVDGTERARIDSSGRLLVGTSSNESQFSSSLQVVRDTSTSVLVSRYSATSSGPVLFFAKSRGASIGTKTVVQSGDETGKIDFRGTDGTNHLPTAFITSHVDGTPGTNDMPGRLVFSTTADGASSPTEAVRITSGGHLGVGQGANTGSAGTIGFFAQKDGGFGAKRSDNNVVFINRGTSDGNLVQFYQGDIQEGSISVSGSTVSYNGAHLARWSQLPGGVERTEILRGTVLSNIDEMCDWGEEENEQLNRMKVSDVEGDKNVSGVFQAWDDDDDTYTNDFYCAMTGDFIIRIAQGVTVERGDLLMSAGDGTAKPQEDDIIRSKTIAKVTSTNVSCTYDDGSYCVPCVLMAC